MKKYLITAALIVAFSKTVFAQNVNQTNTQGLKEGIWQGNYKSNNLKYEGSYNNGIESGVFTFYADAPEKKIIATKDFKADGTVHSIFYNGKKKMSEGIYINKLKEGVWKIYHVDGQHIMAEEPFKNDKLHGIKKGYYISGKLAEEIEYKNGIEDGIANHYAENGIKVKETQYKNGVLDGKIIIRDEKGQITDEAKYVNGSLIVPKNVKK